MGLLVMSIFEQLEKVGVVSKKSKVLYNERTRDVEGVNVWRDECSGVIYIDDFYTGDLTYIDGSYRRDEAVEMLAGRSDLEKMTDAQRRFKSCLKFVSGKRVGDFGCGSGDFLKLVKPYCEYVIGIELQKDYVDLLNQDGITCKSSLSDIEESSLDIIVSFHVVEHLPNPVDVLIALTGKIKKGGYLLIEVPHANDFLLSAAKCDEFKQFTLWSQHLVLHTRESLRKTLEYVGLEDVKIEGVQRYPLSNHLNWLANGKPGGHKSPLSLLDSDALFEAYQSSLARIDATDTLIALARMP